MAGLDNIPQKQSVEIETVKLDESIFNEIKDVNTDINSLVSRFGEIFLRKKELALEIESLERLTETLEDEFKAKNAQLRDVIDSLDEKYPQGRINMQDATITYQPGAPTRKQLQSQQQQPQQPTSAPNGMKVVKQ